RRHSGHSTKPVSVNQLYSAVSAGCGILRFPGLFLFGLTLTIFGISADAQETIGSNPSQACLIFKKELSLGAQLPRAKAKLQAGQTLTVIALGSSSTTGFGTFNSNAAFPAVIKQELLRLRPSARSELTTSGRVMENIPGNIARLDQEVVPYKPD